MPCAQYRCPICKTPLSPTESSLLCENKHCFDFAKEGYVNLLPVQNKKSKAPGDNAEMIQARRRFLDAGYYSGLAACLAKLMANFGGVKTLLDIGCGEGYYSNHIVSQAQDMTVHGVDISKPAVKMCAKKYPNAHFAVASAFDLPYFDDQFDAAISIFSPVDLNETARLLHPGGTLFFVGPGPRHLRALANHVYREAKTHEGNPQPQLPPTLALSSIEHYQDQITVDGQHLLDLLLMTPYYWSCSKENKSKLAQLDELKVELDFDIKVFTKLEHPPEL